MPLAQYTIAVNASPSAGGTVSGGGTFAAASSDTVTATASPSYTFTLNSNVTLVAHFTVTVTSPRGARKPYSLSAMRSLMQL
jgi:hypothetical protein